MVDASAFGDLDFGHFIGLHGPTLDAVDPVAAADPLIDFECKLFLVVLPVPMGNHIRDGLVDFLVEYLLGVVNRLQTIGELIGFIALGRAAEAQSQGQQNCCKELAFQNR